MNETSDPRRDPREELKWLDASQADPAMDRFLAASALAESETTEQTHRPSVHRIRIIAGLASLAAAAGITGGLLSSSGENHKSHSSASGLRAEQALPTPDITTGNKVIDSDIHSALAADTCVTQVGFNDVATMYNRVFGPTDWGKLRPENLRNQADSLASEINANREALNMVPLPADIDSLRQDAFGPQKLPIERYQKELESYLKDFGVKTYFRWSDTSLETVDLTPVIKQLPQSSLEHNAIIRETIVRAIENFADMPPALVREAGIKRVAFGKIIDPNRKAPGDLGLSEVGSDFILFDISVLNNTDYNFRGSNENILNVVANHETMHLWDYRTCLGVLDKAVNDPAYDSFNQTFKYDRPGKTAAQDRLETEGREGPYTTLLSPYKKAETIVVARPYGAANEDEDKATLFGENVLHIQNASNIYATTGRKPVILEEKVALLLARAYKRDSAIADFYVNVLRGARLMSIANDDIETIEAPFLTQQPVNTGALTKAIKPYENVTGKLARALGLTDETGTATD